MNAIPNIMVQLVHIEGPLKGEIQELFDAEIVIGRHPDCQVQFSKDVVTISRKHARIVREGNRFKIIDKSTNGTFVNGKAVVEAYLKDGDVIAFSEGGPKLSFLTQVSDQPVPRQPAAPETSHEPETPPAPTPSQSPEPIPPRPAPSQYTPPPPKPAPAAPHPTPPPTIPSVKVPFAIQYGAALKSFQTLPITLGRGTNCDFMINHPGLNDQHAQIFFAQDQYWIKDLTGMSAVSINGMAIAGQAPLQPDARIALSPQGPRFRFLGGGRLAEVEDPLPEPPTPKTDNPDTKPQSKQDSESIGQKAGTLFKKFFS